MWNECNCVVPWTSIGIALLWDWNENWLFPDLWPLLSFPNLCSPFTASSFRISNSSIGIPSLLLALILVMLPKAHLIFHFRIHCSRWVITSSWLSESLRFFFFLHSSFVYSCYFFLISSASVRSIPFLSFIVPIFAWNIPLISRVFLKRSLVFSILLVSSISLQCSLRKAFLSFLAILWNSAFRWVYLSFCPLLSASSPFSAIYKTSSGNHFASLHLFFLGMVLITAYCTMSWTSGYSSSATLYIRTKPLNLFVTSTV